MSSNDRLWDDIADEVIDYVEERGTGRNRLRGAYLDTLSANGWRNRGFEDLVTVLADNYETIEDHFRRPRDRADDTMKRAIPDMIDGHFAKTVLADRRLADEQDDETYYEMEKAAEIFDRLIRGRGRGRGRDRDRGRDDRDDRDDRRGRGRDRERDRRTADSNLGRERRHNDDRDREQPRRRAQDTVNADPWDVLTSVREISAGPDTEVREERRATAAPARPAPEVDRKPEPVPEVRKPSGGPDYTQAKPHLDFWKDGEHWQAFHLSKWKLTERNGEPLTAVPSLYNIRTHIKYYVKNESGEVREEHIPVSDDNRYVAHELLDNPPTDRVGTSIDLRQLNKKTAVEEEYVDIGEEEEVEVDRLAGTICCVRSQDLSEFAPSEVDSLESVVFAANAKAVLANVKAANQYAVKRTPILISDYSQLRLVAEIGQCVSLTDAAIKMREMKPRFEPAVYKELDRRFTNLVMRAMRYQFQFNAITSMSFANDWERALAYVSSKRGNEFAAGMASRLAPLVRYATLHIEQDGVQDSIGELYEAVTNPDGSVSQAAAVIFVDFLSVIALRDHSDVLGVGHQLDKLPDGASVTATGNRLLSEALRAIYRKATANTAAVGLRLHLTTKDGQVIEVFPYATRTENFILAKV